LSRYVTPAKTADVQNTLPSKIRLNGSDCQVYNFNNLNTPVPLPESPIIESVSVESAPQPLSTKKGKLIGVDGLPLSIKGVNWFGFETAVTVVHGLWQGPTALSQDFQNVAWRIKLLGFNTIRLPFSFQVCILKNWNATQILCSSAVTLHISLTNSKWLLLLSDSLRSRQLGSPLGYRR
jgi:hypothetical protein